MAYVFIYRKMVCNMVNSQCIVILYGQLSGAGGAERVAIEEAKYFGGVTETHLLTFKAEKEALFGNEELKELDIVRWQGYKNASYMSPLSAIRRVLALRSKLKKLSPDVVIGCCWAGWIELYLATLFTPIHYVLHLHGSIFWLDKDLIKYSLIHKRVFSIIRNSVPGHKEFIKPKIKMSLLKQFGLEALAILDFIAIRRAKKVFVLSNHMAWEVKKIYNKSAVVLPISPISESMVNFLPSSDIKKRLNVSGKRVILTISRLDSRKRIDLLIKSFLKISKEFPDIVLVIGGRGPDEKRLKNLARDSGVSNKIIFVGFIDEEDLLNYYYASEIFAYPGWGDYAITVYEALAQQNKIVCSTEMEIEPKVLTSGYVFQAYPSVDCFAEGLRSALNARINTKINPRDFTWDKYFETLSSYIYTK